MLNVVERSRDGDHAASAEVLEAVVTQECLPEEPTDLVVSPLQPVRAADLGEDFAVALAVGAAEVSEEAFVEGTEVGMVVVVEEA